MKKALVMIVALFMVFGSACSSKLNTQESSGADKDDSSASDDGGAKGYSYPDELLYEEGGTESMTIFRCGAAYYACVDGSQGWGTLSGGLPEAFGDELEDGEFIHADAEYKRVYGGIAGYMGNKAVRKISNERSLELNDVVDLGAIAPYDFVEGEFSGLRLIVKDGKNYLICRDPLLQYRVYDDSNNLLCTYETSMACSGFLDEGENQSVQYSRGTNIPYLVVRIGDVYYAYSGYEGNNTWTPLLNMQFENKPVGFELEDGQVMKINSTLVYIVNGGDGKYVNNPMFEKMDHFSRTHYTSLNIDASEGRWEQYSSYENGKSYEYYNDGYEYVIFCLDGRFHVYYGKSSDMETEKILGVYDSAEKVNDALGI